MPTLFEKLNEKNAKKLRSKTKKVEVSKVPVKKQKTISSIEKNRKSVEIFLRENKLPKLEIVSLSYGVIERQTIDRVAACEITNINKSKDPTNTTNDPRLGTIDKNTLCATCEKTNEECPGHLGVIKLPVNIIHPFFRLIVMKVLQSVCHVCKRLLMTEEYLKETGIISYGSFSRLAKISDESKDGKIPCTLGCQCNPIFKSQKSADNSEVDMYCITKIGKQEIPHTLSVSKIKNILSNISDKDVKLMGFQNNHPANFIVDFIPVIPISARPYIIRDGKIQDDYLTSTYSDILSKIIEYHQENGGCENPDDMKNRYKEKSDKVIRSKEECIRQIIYLLDHSIQNCNGEYKRSPSDPCKAINDRISGKESLIRGHMMGKRADFTGRTVLGPNRSISFGEVAAPEIMKGQLTVPEKVTVYNFNYLMKLAEEGKISYLCPVSGVFSGRKLKYDKNKHTINIGDKVGRFSEDGDIILFNRQPTLHKNSMLGYVCKFQKKMSVGIHLSSTAGHNADFDGDEGNIHMLQSIDSQVEGRLLMYAGNNINMSKNSGPAVGMTQNGITGAYLLTRPGLVLSKTEFESGLEYIFNFEHDYYVRTNLETLEKRAKEISSEDYYSGKILCSVLFPPDFTYTYLMDDKEDIIIRRGILISGQLTKVHVGDSPSTIIQSIYKQYGKQATIDFVSNATFLFNWYSEKYGLSISLRDSMPERLEEFQEIKRQKFEELNRKIQNFPNLEDPTDTEIVSQERDISLAITNDTKQIEKIFFKDYLEKNSSLDIMVKSKAKGKDQQIQFITAFLGQIWVSNARPCKAITNGKRWLPTFHVDDNSIYSRGFSRNSFFEGLDPDAYFANSQASRIGVAEQQLKTATTGLLQRRMVKAQENLIVKYDGTVRNHNNIIFQFNYGAGFASTEMTFSSNKLGMKTRSFINMKELIEKENTRNGFVNFNLSNHIVSIFNVINKKYGDEKLPTMDEDDIDKNDLSDFQEILTFQNDEDMEGFADFGNDD
tara:strand:+ start:2277 stop:5279 length:3003 start_codon:yes stop_codon:yes gene_type:complete